MGGPRANAGRKRVPLEKRELEGTTRAEHRKKAAGTPKVDVTLINDCPGLSKEGKKWWPFIRAQLHALPVTTMSDLTAVQRLVETYAEVRICMAVLEDEEWFYESETKNGIIKRANPALGQLNEADRRLRACLIEFGMTPASRTRVKNPTGGDDGYQDPLKEFI